MTLFAFLLIGNLLLLCSSVNGYVQQIEALIDRAKIQLAILNEAYPKYIAAIRTEMATKMTLRKKKEAALELYQNGQLDRQENRTS